MGKLRWGILSTAKIATVKVIPGMLKSSLFKVHAIASRDLASARSEAARLGISKAYGSYEELLADPEIDIIYNPLPNHLHVEWTATAIKAGKHVLCEKPLFLNPEEARELIRLRDQHQVKVGEAFMVKTHPQWIRAKELVDSSVLGTITAYQSTFSYFNADPANIRNIPEYGGGALWDIGCYPVMTSRFLLGENPFRIIGSVKRDPRFGTDIHSSAIMEFNNGVTASFSVSTQSAPYQRVHVFGTQGDLEILVPFNSPVDRPTYLRLNQGDILLDKVTEEEITTCDQYQLQAEAFTKAVMENTRVPVSLEDALDHALIITAIFESAEKGTWISV